MKRLLTALLKLLLIIVNLLTYDLALAFDETGNCTSKDATEKIKLSSMNISCVGVDVTESYDDQKQTTQLIHSSIRTENNTLNSSFSTFQDLTNFEVVNQYTILCSQLILKLNSGLKWSYFLFIYDSYSDVQWKTLMLLLKEVKVLLIPINFDLERKRLIEVFNHLYGSFNFITDCQESNLMKLLTLSQNSENNVLNYPYHWIFISKDPHQNLPFFFGWKFAVIQNFKEDFFSSNIFACITNFCDDEHVCLTVAINHLVDHFKSDSNNRYKSSEDNVYYECELIFGTTYHSSYLGDFEEQYALKGFEKEFLVELTFLLKNSINRLKFSRRLVGNKYDPKDPWKKLMNSLSKKEVGMIMPLGFPTPDVIANRFDLSRPVFEVIYGAVVRRGDVGNSIKEYVKPYDKLVWITMLFSIIFSAVLLSATYILSPISGADIVEPFGQPPSQRYTIGTSSFAMFCAFFSQDQGSSPPYASGRMIFTVFFICSYLVMQGYSAVLTSFIATGSAQLPFTDVQSLFVDKEYTIGTEKLFDIIGMLRNSNNEHVRGLAAKIMLNPNYNLIPNHEEAIARVLNSSFVYITAIHSIEPYLRMNCKLTVAIPEVIRITKHVVLKRHHPFTDAISQQIERLKSSGVVRRIYNKYYPKLPNTCDTKLTVVNPISLQTVSPMFCFLLLSMVVSFLVVSFELFWREKVKKSDKKIIEQSKIVNFNRSHRNRSSLLYCRQYTVYKP